MLCSSGIYQVLFCLMAILASANEKGSAVFVLPLVSVRGSVQLRAVSVLHIDINGTN